MGKICVKCKIEQPETNFFKDKHRPDGLNVYCKSCRKNAPKTKLVYPVPTVIHADGHKACVKCRRSLLLNEFHKNTSRADHLQTVCKTCAAASKKGVVRKSKDYGSLEYKAKQAAIDAKRDPEKKKAIMEKWLLENPGKTQEFNNRQRAKKINAAGSHTAKDICAIFARDEYKCLRCGTEQNLCIDHIHPLTIGGNNSNDNLQTLCLACNTWKSNRTIDFRKRG